MTLPGIFLAAGCLALIDGLYSLRKGSQFLRAFRRSSGAAPQRGWDPLTLIVPCKGLDQGFEHNIRAYLDQDYPDHQIIFVMEDALDPAVEALRAVLASIRRNNVLILFAGQASERGQKVHNLLFALRYLRPNDTFVVWGDSDIRPHRSWLKDLVRPLGDESVGLSTGFRWYLPTSRGFATVLRSAWNAGIAGLMSDRNSFFAWGGAMALRRETLRQCDIEAVWNGALSDDYTLSRAIHRMGLRIRFEPSALSFSYEDCTLRQLLEWSRRQLAITRICHPPLWWAACATQGLFFATLASALLVPAIYGLTIEGWLCALTGLTVYALACIKGFMRAHAVAVRFPAEMNNLRRCRSAYLYWSPLTTGVSLLALVRSGFNRKIEWRGVRYKMISASRTLILER